jgi:hypothetical protein
MPMENMKVPHTYREEWLKSRYSTAENYMPYQEYYAVRLRKDVKTEMKAAKAAAADARKTLKRARKAAGGN